MKPAALFSLLLILLFVLPCAPGLCADKPENLTFPCAAVVVNPDPKDRLNLRQKPSTSSNSLGKFYNSVEVKVLSLEDDWAEVSIGGDLLKGYMLAKYLEFDMRSNPVESATPHVTITDPNGKKLFKSKTANASVLKRLDANTRVTVLAVTQDDWLFIHTGKSFGFIKNGGVSPAVSFSNQKTESHADGSYAGVSRSVPLYKDNKQSEIIRTLEPGELVTVLHFESQLTRITDGKDSGYVSSFALNFECGEWNIPINEYAAVVNCQPQQRLHLRAKPSTSAKSLGRYYTGTRVVINGKLNNGFYPVSVGGLEGYMMADYLTLSGTPAYDSVVSALPILCVTTPSGRLHLRKAADTSSASLGLYSSGKLVALCGLSDEWAHVLVDGQLGFMKLDFLSDPPY